MKHTLAWSYLLGRLDLTSSAWVFPSQHCTQYVSKEKKQMLESETRVMWSDKHQQAEDLASYLPIPIYELMPIQY